jgi:hypothetical protein
MRQRCEKPNSYGWKKYGAKGIRVCAEWGKFEAFRDWAYANGYTDELTIDRIDPRGNYEPSNCRWVTQKVQQNNRTNNVRIAYNGEEHTLSEWFELTGVPVHVLYDRKRRGWDADRIFNQPIRARSGCKTKAEYYKQWREKNPDKWQAIVDRHNAKLKEKRMRIYRQKGVENCLKVDST